MQKTALITGIAGQDGSYLAELLLENGYQVIGTVRDVANAKQRLPAPIASKATILQSGENKQEWFDQLISEFQPHEVYNLAGLSYVPATANEPAVAAEEIAMSAIRLFQAVRKHSPKSRVYQACSSEMFGSQGPFPQIETTPLSPSSPYGAAKAYTFFSVQQFRKLFGIYAVAGITYNHESPRRPPHFVSRRITSGAAQIKLGLSQSLKLGSLGAQRDWGYAKDYVRAMWMMLQSKDPEDYVIATGVLNSVEDLVRTAFNEVGLDWKNYVEVDSSLVRPLEPRPLVGNPSKIQEKLGWHPSMSFKELISLMVQEDLRQLST